MVPEGGGYKRLTTRHADSCASTLRCSIAAGGPGQCSQRRRLPSRPGHLRAGWTRSGDETPPDMTYHEMKWIDVTKRRKKK